MVGRKAKLNQEVIEKAYKYVAAGNHIKTVCQYLGISENTWYTWYRKGEQQSNSIYHEQRRNTPGVFQAY